MQANVPAQPFRHKAVLVLDGTPRTVVAISRSLHARGIPVVHGFSGSRPLSLGSNAVQRDIPLPSEPDELYRALQSAVTDYEIDTLFACSDNALRVLSLHYDQLKNLALLSFPEPEILNIVLDKQSTLRAAERCNVKAPKTFAIRNAQELARLKSSLTFPLVAKPSRTGAPSFFRVRRFDNFATLSEAIESQDVGIGDIFQEFFAGEGVGISTIIEAGRPLGLFQHRRVHEWPATGGVGVLVESEAIDEHLADAALRLLAEIRWQGPAMVEFRHNRATGDFTLMEIHGRFVGSLPLAIQAGVDFPYLLWQVLQGQAPSAPSVYPTGVTVRWTTGEMFRLSDLWTDADQRRALNCGRWRALGQFFSSFEPSIKSALFDLRDPTPAIRDVAQTLRGLTLALLRGLVNPFIAGSIKHCYRQYTFLEKQCRPTYRKLWLRRLVSLDRSKVARIANFNNIVFVCRGNRIRSQLASALLQTMLGEKAARFRLLSAGTRASTAELIDERAWLYARNAGVIIEDRPKRLTAQMVNEADVIIVMDRIIEAEVISEFPLAAPKTVLLSDFAPAGEAAQELPDPDKFGDVEFFKTVSALKTHVETLSDFLAAKIS